MKSNNIILSLIVIGTISAIVAIVIIFTRKSNKDSGKNDKGTGSGRGSQPQPQPQQSCFSSQGKSPCIKTGRKDFTEQNAPCCYTAFSDPNIKGCLCISPDKDPNDQICLNDCNDFCTPLFGKIDSNCTRNCTRNCKA